MNKILLLFFSIIAIVIYFLFIYQPTYNYYIYESTIDPQFKNQVSEILKNTEWRIDHKIKEVKHIKMSDITIRLAGEEEMKQHRGKKQYRSDGSLINFSYTYYKQRPKCILIDQNNWVNGVEQSGLTIPQYREYVINHEFGHGLGYDHQPCNGGTCPVMYQSTRGCPKNAKCGFKPIAIDRTKKL